MRIEVQARRWEHGWELALDGEVVTQVSTLDRAAAQVRDYLDTVDAALDHSDWELVVIPVHGSPSVEWGDEEPLAKGFHRHRTSNLVGARERS